MGKFFIIFAENIKIMSRYVKNIYSKIHEIADTETGEIKLGKTVIGEKFSKEYMLYGTIYDIFAITLSRFDPIHSQSIFMYLMGTAELGTNKINISYEHLIEEMKCSKNTIYRCLNVFKESNTIIKNKNYWVINPIIFFKGTQDQRWELFERLNRPMFVISPTFFRSEFFDETNKIL